MAGYSKTPLPRKLGIEPGMTVHVVNGPEHYDALVAPLPDGAQIEPSSAGTLPAPARFVHLFVPSRDLLERDLPPAKAALAKDATLWVSWPKKAARKLGVETDVDEGQVRRAGLEAGLVDVKICAVDEIWSGLKFVYRLADR